MNKIDGVTSQIRAINLVSASVFRVIQQTMLANANMWKSLFSDRVYCRSSIEDLKCYVQNSLLQYFYDFKNCIMSAAKPTLASKDLQISREEFAR